MVESKGEKVFYMFNYLILGLFAAATLYPFIYVLSASMSSGLAVTTGRVWFFPVEINFEAYKSVFKEKGIWLAYGNTIYYTVVGTFVNLVLTVCGAYALSKRRLMGRKFINIMLAFTLLFSAGMIPTYLNLQDLGLLNTRLAIIIAGGISTFYVVIMRTFFQALPEELEEAAKIDGAGDITYLMKIVLPLSKPALAAIGLFYAVGRWNSYFWAMVILRDENKLPLQVLLTKLVVQMRPSEAMLAQMELTSQVSETIIYATIVVAIIPIIAVYPFIQKYFVQGVMIGTLKG